jgi:hypothetical protein
MGASLWSCVASGVSECEQTIFTYMTVNSCSLIVRFVVMFAMLDNLSRGKQTWQPQRSIARQVGSAVATRVAYIVQATAQTMQCCRTTLKMDRSTAPSLRVALGTLNALSPVCVGKDSGRTPQGSVSQAQLATTQKPNAYSMPSILISNPNSPALA